MTLPYEAERIRDIPRTCICTYTWNRDLAAWQLAEHRNGCPWHS